MGRRFRHHHIPWSKGINPGKTISSTVAVLKELRDRSRKPVSVQHKVATEPGEKIIMIDVYKKMLCLIMTTLLAVSQVGIGLALPTQTFPELGQKSQMDSRQAAEFAVEQMSGPSGEAPMGPTFSGRGFALMGNESHDLMLNVENLILPDPIQVRRLLASNKSVEELRDEINEIQGKAIYRGIIKLDGMVYPMVDINLSLPGEKPITLYANVIEPTFDLTISNETAIAGNIKMMIAPSEDGMVGKGELIMNKGPHVGSYRVLLDLQPIDHGMMR
jgi:hypothetical protein